MMDPPAVRCLLVDAPSSLLTIASRRVFAHIPTRTDAPCCIGRHKTEALNMNDWIDLLQWPAMVVTVLAGLLVGSKSARRRKAGFMAFLLSNALWIAWGWHDDAWALIALQLCLIVTNLRGILKNEE